MTKTDAREEKKKPVEQDFKPLRELEETLANFKESLKEKATEYEKDLELSNVKNLILELGGKIKKGEISEDAPLAPKQKKFIYDKLLREVGRGVVGHKTESEATAQKIAEVLDALLILLRIELEAKSETCQDLCEVIRSIFDVG
jgi:hypothetical protein